MGYGRYMMKFNVLALIIGVFCASSLVQAEETRRIVAIGDSLTAGYGLPTGEDFVTQLETALQEKGYQVEIENAGFSGDTTAGGLQRLDWAIGNGADFVILELGANDALRGLPPEAAKQNLAAILDSLKAAGTRVLLVGMKAPRNYGPDYKQAFDAIYPELAGRFGAVLHPDAFAGIAAEAGEDPAAAQAYVQDDGIHPNAKGVALNVAALGPAALQLVEMIRK